ncbi:MAG: 3'-5' exonuclease [Treponema sp.]|jgi:DNA polymerase-3 subunit epsilon|nr:3'-5' exonuclease [Treponema sp.]
MENIGALAEKYAGNGIFTAFDLETTGLDPQKDRIVEIGAVKFDRLGLIARFSTLVNPGIPMPPEAGKVNNITDEMLAGKPSLDEVLPDFLRFIRDTVLTAYNAPFDCGFVNESLKVRYEKARAAVPGGQGSLLDSLDNDAAPGSGWTVQSLPNPVADTLAIAREVFPGKRSYKLQELAAELQIPAAEAHRAEDDARLCMEIFIRCLGGKG